MQSRTEHRQLASRPDVAIHVSRLYDPSCQWDGDGPDPEEDGFSPYDVSVTVYAIRAGRLYEAEATLGGSYFRDDEEIGEIHGYYPQMLEEALEELDEQLAGVPA